MTDAETPWPFEEPPDMEAITLRPILEGEQPILAVFHDVADRGWQFLAGDEEPDLDDGRVVELAAMVAVDPSVADLADLPIGWVAWRESPDEPWQRGPHYPEDFDELAKEAVEDLWALQDELKAEWALGKFERFDYDQETATIVFSDRGHPVLEADILIVGSTSKESGTWRWAWDNPSVLEGARAGLENVAEFGRSIGAEKLTRASWPGDEHDGWEMTAIAAHLLGADGAYRVPDEGGALFLLLSDVQRIDAQD